jgi:hypothetical protein
MDAEQEHKITLVALMGSAGAPPTFFVAKNSKFSLKTRRKKQSGGTTNVQFVDSHNITIEATTHHHHKT